MSDPGSTKRLFRNTAMLYTRTLFTMAVNLYAVRIILEALGKDDFGIYKLVGGMVVSLSFLNAALTGASARFLAFELGSGVADRLAKVFSAIKEIHWLAALIYLAAAESLGLFLVLRMDIPADRLFAAHTVYQLSIVAALFALVRIPYSAAVIAHEKMDFFAYLGVIEAMLKLLLVFLLTVIPYDKLILYGILQMVTAVVVFCCFAAFCRISFPNYRFKLILDKSLFLPILSFSSWNLYVNMAISVKATGVNYITNRFFPLSVNAAQGLTERVDGSVTGFVSNFLTAVQPQIVKYYARNAMDEMMELVRNAAKYSFLALLLVVTPLLLEMEFLMNIWLGAELPEYAVDFCRIVLFQSLLMIIFKPIGFAIHASGNLRRLSLINGTIYLAVIPLVWWLFYIGLPPISAYVGDFILVGCGQTANLFTLRKYVHYSINGFILKTVFPCFACMAVAWAAPLALELSMNCGWIKFFAVGTVSVLSVSVFGYLLLLDRAAKNYLRTKAVNAGLKIKTFLLK